MHHRGLLQRSGLRRQPRHGELADVGFPGAYASYYDLVDKHGIKIDRAPTSLGEDVHGHVHLQPGIPARSP
jgi:hypothetical protein